MPGALCVTAPLWVPQCTEDRGTVGGPEMNQLQGAPTVCSDIPFFVRHSGKGKGLTPEPKVSTLSGLVLPPMEISFGDSGRDQDFRIIKSVRRTPGRKVVMLSTDTVKCQPIPTSVLYGLCDLISVCSVTSVTTHLCDLSSM